MSSAARKNVRRIHWGMNDPASVQGSNEERLTAFRIVRDELKRRINEFGNNVDLQ